MRTHGELAVIGAGATVGPFSYLRPGTVLGAGGKIGAFVETKNAEIGDGAKVPHLSYVGDAEIGEGTNIGAGTIFANYDGVAKHRTNVGRHARTGVQQHLRRAGRDRRRRRSPAAAPSYAGTSRRARSPVSGGPQRNLEGWAQRKRPGTAQADAAAAAASGTGQRPTSDRRTVGQPAPAVQNPERDPPGDQERARDRNEADHREEPDGLQRPGPPRARRGGRRRSSAPRWCRPSAYEFANSEIYVRFEESVRGCDAFVIQSHTAPINEWIMEHLIMVDALKRASAKRITVVMPFYGYARQDKKHRGREPISARLMADLFKTAGADRLITVDLHADQIQGFFDGPVDHLMALPILADHVQEQVRRPAAGRRLARTPAGSRSPSAGRPASAARRWRSSTRPATSTGPTRRSPTGSSVTSRAGSACWSTT